jgi:anti-sigma-K factor RskA
MSGARHNRDSARDDASCPFEEQGYPAVYVVDALDGQELVRFIAHLPVCAICPPAVAEFRATVAQLPLLVEPERPSPELRARILAAVAAEAGTEPQRGAPAALSPTPLRRRAPQIYALAAVLLLALGLGQLAWNLTLQRDLQRTRAELNQVQGALASTRWQLAAAQAGQPITGELVYLRDRQQAVLVVNGLPALQPNQVYEVWLVNEGSAPVPQTVFLTSTTAIQADLDHYQRIAITIEPGPRGSTAPTSPILAVGSRPMQ